MQVGLHRARADAQRFGGLGVTEALEVVQEHAVPLAIRQRTHGCAHDSADGFGKDVGIRSIGGVGPREPFDGVPASSAVVVAGQVQHDAAQIGPFLARRRARVGGVASQERVVHDVLSDGAIAARQHGEPQQCCRMEVVALLQGVHGVPHLCHAPMTPHISIWLTNLTELLPGATLSTMDDNGSYDRPMVEPDNLMTGGFQTGRFDTSDTATGASPRPPSFSESPDLRRASRCSSPPDRSQTPEIDCPWLPLDRVRPETRQRPGR